MGWNSTGTISVQKGSKNVVGVGTQFVTAKVKPGYGFLGPDFSLYEVETVTSETALTIKAVYRGANAAAGSAFAIFQTQSIIGELAEQVALLLSNLAPLKSDYAAGNLAKTINGLAATNGDVPLTTSNVTEGAKLFYTDLRVATKVAEWGLGGGITSTGATIDDVNSVNYARGFYYMGVSTLNRPAGGGALIHVPASATSALQIASAFGSTQALMFRTKGSSVLQPWVTLAPLSAPVFNGFVDNNGGSFRAIGTTSTLTIGVGTSTVASVNNVRPAGAGSLDFNDSPSDGVSGSAIRFNRSVITSGTVAFQLHKSDGSSSASHQFIMAGTTGAGNERAEICREGGKAVIGAASVDSVAMLLVNGPLKANGPVKLGAYTLTTLPSASAYSGYLIEVTNATGGAKICRSNGTVWQILNTTITVS